MHALITVSNVDECRFGRDNFPEACKISSKAFSSDIDWSKFKYMVFDIPTLTGTYAERYAALGKQDSQAVFALTSLLEAHMNNKQYQYMELARKEVCRDIAHLEQMFQDIVDKGGEGVILRDPQCPYEPGRSRGYLKHKVSQTQSPLAHSLFQQKFRDAEAKIVKELDAGQWECML